MPKKPAKQKVGKAPAMADPILAAIDAHKEITRQWLRLEDKLDKAELCAMEKFGRRPLGLITWRSYSAIGEHELEMARDEGKTYMLVTQRRTCPSIRSALPPAPLHGSPEHQGVPLVRRPFSFTILGTLTPRI
jgi:hypothetical protein